MQESSEEALKELFQEYSFEDIAKSLFVINTWLPNVSSHAKSEYLYVILESVFDKLKEKNQIQDYEKFKTFSDKILKLIPSFHMVEDYLPENDWGEIKYYFEQSYYKVFYGGDLENTYDFMYAFETFHLPFNDFYIKTINRSPIEELRFCLELQNSIISNIDKNSQDISEIDIGNIKTPSVIFWETAIEFLNYFDTMVDYNEKLVAQYTMDYDSISSFEMPSNEDFLQNVPNGRNCPYYFIKKNHRIFPILPRRYFSILFDKWGKIYFEYNKQIEAEVEYYDEKIGPELYRFINRRSKEGEVYFCLSAINTDLQPHKVVFASAFMSKNKLVLIHVLPPPADDESLKRTFDSLAPELIEVQRLLSHAPTRIGLRAQNSIIQFDSVNESDEVLETLIITIVPCILISKGSIRVNPEGFVGEVLSLDQFLGIVDEMGELDEIADFFDYMKQLRASGAISFNSLLDHFVIFKDRHGVLIEGAINPDFLMLDLHWGSSFRFDSLSYFWKNFPEESMFGYPRSWVIAKKYKADRYVILRSKVFFGYAYYFNLNKISIFINSPVDSLTVEQIKITDSLMYCLIDSFMIYEDSLKNLQFTKKEQKIHILFFPSFLVHTNKKLNHLNHLIPENGSAWSIDIDMLEENSFGIRVVYNEEVAISSFMDAKDRSYQVSLFKSILEQLNIFFEEVENSGIEKQLDLDKSKANRFRIYAIERKVSFPEHSHYVMADKREYKLADKMVAEIGKANSIVPNKYIGSQAKERIDSLKEGVIRTLNERIMQFNLITAIPLLISNIDSLINDNELKQARLTNSMDQEVNYEREVIAGKHSQDFLMEYRCNQYLIEKFVQLQPGGGIELKKRELAEILAIIDRLLNFYSVSDYLLYDLYPPEIEIKHDYLVEIKYREDIELRRKLAAEEQAKIRLGLIGNNSDNINLTTGLDTYIDKLDEAFLFDLGFGLKDLIDVHGIMGSWASLNAEEDSTYYCATLENITKVCTEKLNGFEFSKIGLILNFLTLDPLKILTIEGRNVEEPDLPVWEHRKRSTRYNLKPLIMIDKVYYWGAYSVFRSGQLWAGVTINNKLPSDIMVPTVLRILQQGHEANSKSLQEKIKEIVCRFTPYVESEVFPHKLKFSIDDVGDIDVFALLVEKNIILNIESKIIDQAFSNKDLKRIAEKIFGRKKSNGTFEGKYIHKVIKRDNLLREKGKEIAERFWSPLSERPEVVSIFVTQTSYWWTKYPIIESNVHFVEIQMLEHFIKNIYPMPPK